MKSEWKDFLNSVEYIPASWDRQNVGKERTSPFCLTIKSVDVPYDGGKEEAGESLYHVCLAFFDTTYNQFFGRKWCGSCLPAKFDKNGKSKIQFNQDVYFHTNLMEEAIVIVMEIVRASADHGQESVVGWGLFRLFKYDGEILDVSCSDAPDLLNIKLFHGSARALFYLEEPIEETPELKVVTDLQINFTVRTHKAFECCTHLVPHNFLLGTKDIVAGLAEAKPSPGDPAHLPPDPFRKPKPLKAGVYQLEKITIDFDPALIAFETELCTLVNQDRLQRDGRRLDSDDGMVEVVERRLQIGVHNGWTYTDELEVAHMISAAALRRKSMRRGHQRTPSAGSLGNEVGQNSLYAKNPVEVAIPPDTAYAVVFLLEYVIAEPKSHDDRRITQSMGPTGQQSIAVRWCVFCPFASGCTDGEQQLDLELQGGPCLTPDAVIVFRGTQPNSDVTVTARLRATFRPKPRAGDQLVVGAADSVSQETASIQSKAAREVTRPPGESYSFEPTSATAASGDGLSFAVPPAAGASMPMPHPAQMLWYQQMMASMFAAGPSFANDPGERLRPVVAPPFVNAPPVIPIGPAMHSGIGLSRAAYARLYTAGFPQLLDRHGEAPEVMDAGDPQLFDVRKEEADRLQCNEIVFQFLAFARLWEEQFQGKEPRNVYFTFQFYRFPQFTTERLSLHEPISNLAIDQNCTPFILQKVDPNGDIISGAPGYQVKYNVDPSFLKPGEGRLFAEYLSQQVLHIDVWDADSMLLVGSCAVELKNLCRQGREAVQVSYELEVASASYAEESSALTGDVTTGGSVRPIGARRHLRGRLHLRLANIGYTTKSAAGAKVFTPARQKHLVAADNLLFTGGSLATTTLSKSLSVGDLSGGGGGGGTLGHVSELGNSRRVVRARPAATTDRELAQLLNTRRGEPEGAGAKAEAEAETDADRKRKLRRMEALRQLNPDLSQPDLKTLSVRAYRQDKSERMRDLKTIELHRLQAKHSNIKSMLSQAVCVEHILYPSFGSTEFFEFQLKNPYNRDHSVVIQIDDPHDCLHLVTDAAELRALKLTYGVTSPIETDLLSTDPDTGHATLFLRPKEAVLVPFKYVELLPNSLPAGQPEGPLDPRRQSILKTISANQNQSDERSFKVHFTAVGSDQKVGELLLRIAPQPPIIDQTFRFHHPEHSFFRKTVRLPPFQLPMRPANAVDRIFARCSDREAVCEARHRGGGEPCDVFIKVSLGASPETRRFLVAIYLDQYLLRPAQIWQFFVHSQQRVDAMATEGQVTRLNLLLRGTHSTRQVRVFTSHPREVAVQPTQNFLLASNAVHELQVVLNPMHGKGVRVFHVHVVDVEFHQVLRAWLLCVQCRPPEVTKAFELQLPVGGGQACNKRISYSNPYPHKKNFTLTTSRPDLLQFKDSELMVGAGETTSLGLRFAPTPLAGTHEIYVFLLDEDDKNEETFAITAVYA